MRILIINDLRQGGGAEVQSERERSYFVAHGHDVFMLNFDCDLPYCNEGRIRNIPLGRSSLEKALYRVFPRPEDSDIKQIIESISPDIIHLNNVYLAAASVFDAIRYYPVVQTVRDYSIICPKSTCIDNGGVPCGGYSFGKCLRCSFGSVEYTVRTLIQARYNRIRSRAVDRLLAPSVALCRAASECGFVITPLNNPFDFTRISSLPKSIEGKRKYFSYGRISRVKGFDSLIDAWKIFADGHDVELWIAGTVDNDYEDSFKSLIEGDLSIRYLGKLDYDAVMALYPFLYCVVVPSIWMENYPNTVLEALANRTLVIGSDRGGIPEMIGDERFIFNPLDITAISEVLIRADTIPSKEYSIITGSNYSRVRDNNSQDKYYERLMGVYSDMLEGSSIAC